MTENYAASGLRHLTDAETLALSRRWGGAGHLVGFAAECAIKHAISTLRPLAGVPQKHFPDIVPIARKHLKSRRHSALYTVLRLPALMDGWNVALRYSSDGAVREAHFRVWQNHAIRLLSAAGLRR